MRTADSGPNLVDTSRFDSLSWSHLVATGLERYVDEEFDTLGRPIPLPDLDPEWSPSDPPFQSHSPPSPLDSPTSVAEELSRLPLILLILGRFRLLQREMSQTLKFTTISRPSFLTLILWSFLILHRILKPSMTQCSSMSLQQLDFVVRRASERRILASSMVHSNIIRMVSNPNKRFLVVVSTQSISMG